MITPEQYHEMEARLAAGKKGVEGRCPDVANDAVDDESGLHREIIAECRRRLWPYVHSRMDKRATIGVGVVDFVIAADNERVLWIECKAGKKTLSKEQMSFAAMLRRNGHHHHEVRSFREFMAIVQPPHAPHHD